MNPAPSEGHADIAQQLAVRLDGPARNAGLVPRVSIFNLGEPDDYRVPDGGLLRERLNRVRAPTAALVIEIVSADDDTRDYSFALRQGNSRPVSTFSLKQTAATS